MNRVRVSSKQTSSSADCHKPCVLLTGATGLLGQYLMGDLIAAGHQLAVVARPTRKESAAVRIERIMQQWESRLQRSLPRPVVIAGFVDQPNFGMAGNDLSWVRDHCGSMIHNAAVLQFRGDPPSQEPWITNLQGTQHAIELARQAGIKHFHYVSTAYVCGARQGTIREDEFDCGQDFRNDYERSKFASEKLVRESDDFESKTIYRPSVIAGDSRTGYTSTYHGLYVYLRLFAMFVPQQQRDENGRLLTRVKVPMDGDEPRNVVTVDWVSKVIRRIFETPGAHNEVYHLTPDVCLTPRFLIDSCFEFFDSCGVEFCGSGNAQPSIDEDFANRMFENVAIYQDYDSSDPQFDRSHLLKVAGDIPCPPIDRETIHQYLRFGILDKWGKARPQRIELPDIQPQLEMIRMAADQLNGDISRDNGNATSFGLRITGTGGGDWRIGHNEQGELEISRGLGTPRLGVIELPVRELQLGNGDIEYWKALISDRLPRSSTAPTGKVSFVGKKANH